MPRSLADGRIKLAALTTEPADPLAPTTTELDAGIGGAQGIGCFVKLDDWTFGPTDSETVNERAVCEEYNTSTYGPSNYEAGMTVFLFFDADTGAIDPVENVLFEAVKAKGSRLWLYQREMGKKESEPWTAADDLFFGAEVVTDNPQRPGETGYIKRRIPMQVQKGYPNAVVAAGV